MVCDLMSHFFTVESISCLNTEGNLKQELRVSERTIYLAKVGRSNFKSNC